LYNAARLFQVSTVVRNHFAHGDAFGEFRAQFMVRGTTDRMLHRRRHQQAVEHHRLPFGQMGDSEIERLAGRLFSGLSVRWPTLATIVANPHHRAFFFPVRHQQLFVPPGQAIFLRPCGKGNDLLFQGRGVSARLATTVERRLDHLAALTESFDLGTADIR
jgi:hypothetical protein